VSAMSKLLLVAGVLSLSLSIASNAMAQGYMKNTPGQLPTYVNPQLGGGYTINTPGRLPTYVIRNWAEAI
jgi:hypothetical protein